MPGGPVGTYLLRLLRGWLANVSHPLSDSCGVHGGGAGAKQAGLLFY